VSVQLFIAAGTCRQRDLGYLPINGVATFKHADCNDL
jgi:hypothetical protein